MIATLPLAPRNRLADLIVAALSGRAARAELLTLARDETTPGGWLRPDEQFHAPLLIARVKRAAEALAKAPMWSPELTVEDALDAAATLFDAGLYFETHEVLGGKMGEFKTAVHEGWRCLLAKNGDARLLWFWDHTHGKTYTGEDPTS